MHDIDLTRTEINPEMEAFEYEQFEMPGETGGVFNEAEEMELAAELLEVSTEQELDRFLGDLIRRVGGTLRRAVNTPVGQAVGSALKSVVRQALPGAGQALGAALSGPLGPLGQAIGGSLASAAGGALGLEFESLNQEDREFEGAKQFVRLAADTAKSAVTAPPGSDPRATAQGAAAQAAQALAPGLLQPTLPSSGGRSPSGISLQGRSGRWIRRGSKIVLLGV